MPQENQQAEQIKEYYIAYFDLLGYKEFFQSYPDKVENFYRLYMKQSPTQKITYKR